MKSFAAPDNQDPWRLGQIINNHFEVKGILGEGGMGRVYRVHFRDWQRDIAVKRPLPTIFARAGGKELFMREAETWVKLEDHMHVIPCHFVYVIASIPCIFIEYMAGGSLADGIEEGHLYQRESTQIVIFILALAIQMAQGLDYAHTQGLVHRDVKPANVLLTPEGIARITDFGLAQARFLAGEVTRASRAGASGVVPGVGVMTMAYASPEQVEGRPLTHHTDMWSWAISVLDMFMGATIRGYGPAAAEALENYLREGPDDPALPPMPPGVVALLRQCLQRDPAARPASMREVVNVLQGIFSEVQGSPYPRVPQSEGSSAGTLLNRAISLRELGKLEEALATSEQALLLDPQDSLAWADKGATLYKLKQYEEALAACEKSLSLNSQDAYTWRTRGDTLRVLQRYEEALAAYEQALLLDPQDAGAWANKGFTLSDLKCYEEALATYEQALRLDPLYALAWTEKGFTLHKLQRYEEALAAYEQAFHLDSQGAYVWMNKGETLYALKRYEEALVAYEQVLLLDPQWTSVWGYKGDALYKLQRYEEAINAFKQALRLKPNLDSALRGLAAAFRALGRVTKAEQVEAQVRALKHRREHREDL